MSHAVAEVGSKPRPEAPDELRLFRNLMRSMTCNAMTVVDDLEMWCRNTDQLERCDLLRKHLDCMKRLCEGKA
jgi:hypothetical protein